MCRKYCLPVIVAAILVMLTTIVAQAAVPETLYAFGSESGSGSAPDATVLQDAKGNLYGTTSMGGGSLNCWNGCGIIYELSPASVGGWTYTTLYVFGGGSGGYSPSSPLVQDAAGNLYGTTAYGGIVNSNCSAGCGIVYELSPTSGGGWTFSTLYSFRGAGDGARPLAGLIFDMAGNLYGTANQGGSSGGGTIFKLTRNAHSTWNPSVVYTFKGSRDGAFPAAGVIFDVSGNLYGVAADGGALGYGTAFELSPSGNGWTFHLLYAFAGAPGGDGAFPDATLIFDKAGNLYGTTIEGGSSGDYGTVFILEPTSKGWSEHVLHSFSNSDGASPRNGLVQVGAGSFYGTTISGGAGCSDCGTIFELSRASGDWDFTTAYNFTGGTDGFDPAGGLILGAGRNLYGTTAGGGLGDGFGGGVVFQMSLH